MRSAGHSALIPNRRMSLALARGLALDELAELGGLPPSGSGPEILEAVPDLLRLSDRLDVRLSCATRCGRTRRRQDSEPADHLEAGQHRLATVGTSGSAVERFSDVTASARSLPDFTWPIALGNGVESESRPRRPAAPGAGPEPL